MSIVNNIKKEAQKAGSSKKDFLYLKDGQNVRVRFLQDLDEGWEIPWLSAFEAGVNNPNPEFFDREWDEDEDIKERVKYAWCVYNYDTKKVQVLCEYVTNCTPVTTLTEMFDNYGTLLDRDYVFKVSGSGSEKQWSVIPQDKQKFRNSKAKPFSTKEFKKRLDKAFPLDFDIDDEDEEDMEDEYADMTAKQLYKECKKRDIECKQGKKEKYYINLLVEDDKANDDWDEDEDDDDDETPKKKSSKKSSKKKDYEEDEDDEDDDDLDEDDEDDEDEDDDYEEWTKKELKAECKERGLKVKKDMDKDDLIEMLEDDDEDDVPF